MSRLRTELGKEESGMNGGLGGMRKAMFWLDPGVSAVLA